MTWGCCTDILGGERLCDGSGVESGSRKPFRSSQQGAKTVEVVVQWIRCVGGLLATKAKPDSTLRVLTKRRCPALAVVAALFEAGKNAKRMARNEGALSLGGVFGWSGYHHENVTSKKAAYQSFPLAKTLMMMIFFTEGWE